MSVPWIALLVCNEDCCNRDLQCLWSYVRKAAGALKALEAPFVAVS